MAKITLTVTAVTENARSDIKKLQEYAVNVFSKPIQIKVDASGLDAVAKTIKEMSAALGKDGGKGGASGAAESVNDLTNKVNQLASGMRIAKQTITEFSDAETKTARQYTDDVNKMVTVTEQGNKTVIQSTEKFAKVLSDEEKAMHTNAVRAKAASDAYGELIDSQEKMVDGQVVQAVNKYRDSLGNVTTVTAKLKGETVEVSTVTRENSEQMKKQADAAELAAKRNTLLGDSLDRIVAKIIAWQVINATVASVIRAFREAVETIKAVDSELVTIRKTTDFNEQQIAALTEKTYELASAYGRTADELLNLSSTFARAGMGDQIEEMTELAALLENVGDIEGDTAAKFILAANAAWKLGGDYNALMQIIDGMNAVTNQAAVDMEALTTGITVAGSVFANAGETAQTYTAMVGTAVAATQRSGSEVARGLRTIAMNIRSIKGELEDGEIIDEESISDAAAALHSVGISVADANGELRLTSDVLDDLAGKWNSLTTAEQAYLAESLAGKRQANILTALMQNWSEVERQMTLYANGAGSALKENELYLDSWEAKSKKLSAARTEFISHFVDTKVVKTALEALTGVVKVLDTNFGRAVITVLAFSAGISAITKGLPGLISKITGGGGLIAGIQAIIGAVKGAEGATLSFSAVWAASPFAVITTIVAYAAGVITLITKLVDDLNYTAEEHIEDLNKAAENYREIETEIQNINGKIEENNRLIAESNELGKSQAYIDRIKAENDLLQVQLDAKERALEIAREEAHYEAESAFNANTYTWGTGRYNERTYRQQGEDVTVRTEIYETGNIVSYTQHLLELAKAGEDVRAELNEAFTTLTTISDGFKDGMGHTELYRAQIQALTDEYKQLYGLYGGDEVKKMEEDHRNAIDTVKEEIDVLKQLNDEIDSVQSALKTIRAAQDEYNESGAISVDTLQALLQLEPKYLAALIDENGQINLNSEAVSTLIEGKNVLLERLAAESVATYAAQEAERLLAEQEGNAGTAAQTAAGKLDIAAQSAELLATSAIKGASGVTALDMSLQRLAGEKGLKKNYAKELIDNVTQYANALSGAIGSTNLGFSGWSPSSSGSSRSGGGSSGSSAGSDKDPELERLKDAVALEKQRLSFLETSNASEEEQIAKMREVQDALHAQADYMRSIGASEKDVLALSTEWWQYQNKIDKLLEDAAKKAQEAAEAEAKALREGIASTLEGITEELEKQAGLATSPLQEELDALKAAHELRKEDTEEAEKLLAVEKARIALENAERERNVRVYNAKTGQWEWVANAQTVASARENLTAAQKALDDFYAENAYNAKVKALEERIENTSSAFDELIKAITDAAKAVRDGSMTGKEAYAGIGAAMEGIDPIYRQGLAGALIGRMKANSAAWHDAGPDERAELEAQNLAIGTSLGWHRGADGVWYDAVGSRAYDRWTDADVVSPFGFGSAVSGTGYDAMLRSMGIVTSAGGAGGGYAGGSGGTSIGEQHNGDVYQIGGVTLTEGQARGMTVYDLMQMAGELALHGG